MAKAKLRIVEVPSFEFERIHGQSNLNTWRDGLRVLRALAVERVNGKGRAAAPATITAAATAALPPQPRTSADDTADVVEFRSA